MLSVDIKTTELANGNLLLTVDEHTQNFLKALQEWQNSNGTDRFCSDETLYEILERFICNSEYAWIRPEEIGALTAAPILGIYGTDAELPEDMDEKTVHITCCDHGRVYYSPVVKAWAYMDYQVKSLAEELANLGRVILQSGTVS